MMGLITRNGRRAGILYLVFLVVTVFAGIVRTKVVVFDDAAATAKNIHASEWLFRVALVSDLVGAVLFLLVAWALYVLLRPVDKDLALLFVLLLLGGVAIQGLNLLNQGAALLALSGVGYLHVFRADQLQALAMLFLDLHRSGFMIAQLFYGAWLFPLGFLVFKSRLVPRILGILLMIDGLGVLIWFFQFFLFPGYEAVTYPGLVASAVAEFSLALWLSVRGARRLEGEPAV